MPKGYKYPKQGIQSFRRPTTVEKFLLERGEFQSYILIQIRVRTVLMVPKRPERYGLVPVLFMPGE